MLLADGSPCGDATVGTYALGWSTVTDARGRFLLESVPGREVVDLHVTCFGPEPRPPFRVNGVKPGTEDLELRFEPSVTISGIVVDADGSPAAGGYVYVARADGGLPLTDGSNSTFFRVGTDGRFTVTGIAPVPHRIWARSAFTVGPERRVDAPARDVRLVRPPPRIVTGHLAGTGNLGGFELVAYGAPDPGVVGPRPAGRSRSDADGAFSLELRFDGPYEILVTRWGDDRVARVTGVLSGTKSLAVTLVASMTIEGMVSVASDRSLPDDVWVTADAGSSGESRTAHVEPDGRFRLTGLFPGAYRVQVGSLSDVRARTTVDDVPAGATGLRLEFPER